jgi:hypothetical protein
MFKRKGWTDYFIISISKTRKQMHKDILSISQTMGDTCDYIEEGVGALVKAVDKLDKAGNLLFSVCFLNMEDLTFNIIMHECVHIGMNHEEIACRFGLDYGHIDNVDEERLAYFVGETAEAILQLLKKEKYITNMTWTIKETVEWEYKGMYLPKAVKDSILK